MSLLMSKRRVPEPTFVSIRAGKPIEFSTGRARPAAKALAVVLALLAMTAAGLFI